MAGAGYKDFTAGDVLTAAQVDTYLMEQSTMVFSTASARDTALSAVKAEGMMAYLADAPNRVTYYNGSAWKTVWSDWVTFTPSWTNVTLGTSPTNVGAYHYEPHGIRVLARLTLGSGSGGITGSVSMTVPNGETANVSASLYGMGSLQCVDDTVDYTGVVRIVHGATEISLYAPDNLSSLVPFAWAPGDKLWFDITVPL